MTNLKSKYYPKMCSKTIMLIYGEAFDQFTKKQFDDSGSFLPLTGQTCKFKTKMGSFVQNGSKITSTLLMHKFSTSCYTRMRMHTHIYIGEGHKKFTPFCRVMNITT